MRISDWSSDVCFRSPRGPRRDRDAARELRADRDPERLPRRLGPGLQPGPGAGAAAAGPADGAPWRRLDRIVVGWNRGAVPSRSEEHTSELQSLMRISYAVFCLKKKKNTQLQISTQQ